MVWITNIRFGAVGLTDMVRFRLRRAGDLAGCTRRRFSTMSVPAATDNTVSAVGWRTPLVVIVCGCLIAAISFGPRSALGFFLTPLTQANHWGRDVFAFALAVQNLLWGVGQPLAGAIADRFGAPRVLVAGTACYVLGLVLMAHATTAGALTLSAGVLIGFGLSGCAFTIVVGAFGKLVPPHMRSSAFGFGTAAGSFGQFLYSPLAVALMDAYSWQTALLVFAGLMLLIVPLSMALSTPRAGAEQQTVAAVKPQPLGHALTEAFGHRSYVLLVLGFFTCGFQLAFVTVHLPSYLLDRGLSAEVGGWTLATIGLFNIIGSLTSGYLGNRMPKRRVQYVAGEHAYHADLCRRDRTALAVHRAADLRAGGGDVRHALACHAVRHHLLQPPGGRLPRRLARRLRVRPFRIVQSGVVAVGDLGRHVGHHQLADRRAAGRTPGAVGRLAPSPV